MTRINQYITLPMCILLIALVMTYLRGTAYKKALEKNQRMVLANTATIKQLEQQAKEKAVKKTEAVAVVTNKS